MFGALPTPQLFGDLSFGGYIAMVLAIVLIRPVSLLLSLLGTRFHWREKLVAAWFGPKGFASVVYGLLVLQTGIPQGEEAFTLIAVCIAFSITAHSSTDVPVARLFDVEDRLFDVEDLRRRTRRRRVLPYHQGGRPCRRMNSPSPIRTCAPTTPPTQPAADRAQTTRTARRRP
ncbi:hypothetical protein AQI96_28380 [Streptomyces canus]|nr:hypothetical protein AQI96_28380 [Streptomyces canus]